MMRGKKIVAAALALAVMNTFNAFAFGSRVDESAQGYWSDTDNLTWTYSDGVSYVIGAGPRFCDTYPEITDPEYFLKESICYPGELPGTLNHSGQPKASYTEGTLPLLQEFVYSFDWIHSDEITRLKMVHERIAKGRNGNRDQTSSGTFGASFNVMENKIGNCGNYSWEFEKLCGYVGLECVNYTSGYLHASNLVKINGQWITVDPFLMEGLFNNVVTVPVDYELEYNRYNNEYRNSEDYQKVMDDAELDRKVQEGEISWAEYYQSIYPDLSIEEIRALYQSNGIELNI